MGCLKIAENEKYVYSYLGEYVTNYDGVKEIMALLHPDFFHDCAVYGFWGEQEDSNLIKYTSEIFNEYGYSMNVLDRIGLAEKRYVFSDDSEYFSDNDLYEGVLDDYYRFYEEEYLGHKNGSDSYYDYIYLRGLECDDIYDEHYFDICSAVIDRLTFGDVYGQVEYLNNRPLELLLIAPKTVEENGGLDDFLLSGSLRIIDLEKSYFIDSKNDNRIVPACLVTNSYYVQK